MKYTSTHSGSSVIQTVLDGDPFAISARVDGKSEQREMTPVFTYDENGFSRLELWCSIEPEAYHTGANRQSIARIGLAWTASTAACDRFVFLRLFSRAR